MMNKELVFGMAVCGLLSLSSCAVQRSIPDKQPLLLPPAERTVVAISDEDTPPSQKVRREDIPLLEVDALSVYQQMINYFTPEDEAAPVVSSEQLTAFIDFPAGDVAVKVKYGNNAAELAKLKQQLTAALHDGSRLIKGIRLTGFASPDGNTKENERLAGNRSIQFKNYLLKELNLNPSLITIDWVGEDWDGLRSMVAASGKEYAASVLNVIDNTQDPAQRRSRLKALDKGAPYKDIEKTLFARLRRMQLIVDSEPQTAVQDNASLARLIYIDPAKLSLSEMLNLASLYRPGTEQYREVYEIAAYAYPSCAIAQLNAAASSLALGDKESARYFLQQVDGDPRSYNNLGVLALMDGDTATAAAFFRKAMSQNPRLSRENLKLVK